MASRNPYRPDDPRWMEWESRVRLATVEACILAARTIPVRKPLTVRDVIVAFTVTLAVVVLLVGGALWVTP